MPRDSRMSRLLHALIHLERHVPRATSDALAAMLGTNPVVVRRMMAGLRDKGYLRSAKGHGGGWELRCGLEDITLLDVYEATGEPALFLIGPHGAQARCLVEQAVDARLAGTLGEAEALLKARFAAITVADVARDFEQRMGALPASSIQAAGCAEP